MRIYQVRQLRLALLQSQCMAAIMSKDGMRTLTNRIEQLIAVIEYGKELTVEQLLEMNYGGGGDVVADSELVGLGFTKGS